MSEFNDFIDSYSDINKSLNDQLINNPCFSDYINTTKKMSREMNKLFNSFDFVHEYSTRKGTMMSIYDILTSKSNTAIDTTLLSKIESSQDQDYDVNDLIVDDYDICQQCSVKLKYNNMLKIHSCPICGISFMNNEIDHTQFYVEQNGVSNLNDTVRSIHSPSEHNRIKHFIGYLDKMMGVEIITIPTKVFDIIDNEMQNDCISSNDIFFNFNLIKKYLRRKKLNKWIPHISKIYKRYTGNNLIDPLTSVEKNKIITMYKEIQSNIIYYLLENKRKNFPTCWYFIRKISEHLNIKLDIDIFHKIKLDKNTRSLDMMWKYICKKINIEFIPTI